ncbi:hypothetical protein [Actinomadura miaoliensis]|uniref:Uncharacterized protein n=1 Tax=Actinomadura miaoliensis TaxID=430685 RepID=A0ABP7V8W1_9ACTN
MRSAHAHRRALVRTAAQAAAWWVPLLAIYAALVSTLSPTEVLVGAAVAAASAVAGVAARRTLLNTRPARGGGDQVRRLAVRLPGRIAADTARVLAPRLHGQWDQMSVGRQAARRGAVTLLVSASPGGYVAAVDPDRGVLTVHRLTRAPTRTRTPTRTRNGTRNGAGHDDRNGR